MPDLDEIWGGVTDPAKHDAGNFRYLIHAFNPMAKTSISLVAIHKALSEKERGIENKVDPAYGDQTINLYDNPERLAGRISLSMSLIDQDHTGTWGDGGLIVEVPEQNIVATSNTDMGAMNGDPNFLMTQAQNHPKLGGDELLQVTHETSYNEVVAFANLDGSKIALKGFFIKTDSKGKPINPALAQKMQSHARRLGLPVVSVKNIGLYAENKISFEDGDRLAVHFEGQRYLLKGFNDRNFYSYDEVGNSNFVDPASMEKVLQYIREARVNSIDCAQLEEAYQKAGVERHRAKFSFDADGKVDDLRQIYGYGSEEIEYVVTAEGYARGVYKEKEADAMRAIGMSSTISSRASEGVYFPMMKAHVEKMIAEAKDGLSLEQLAEVESWAGKILSDVERLSQLYSGRTDRDRLGSFKFSDFKIF